MRIGNKARNHQMSHEENIAKRWGGGTFRCPDAEDEPDVRHEPLWCGCCMRQVESVERIGGIDYCEDCINQGIDYEPINE